MATLTFHLQQAIRTNNLYVLKSKLQIRGGIEDNQR